MIAFAQACYANYFGSRSRSRSRAKGGRARNLSKFYNNEDDMLARSTVEVSLATDHVRCSVLY